MAKTTASASGTNRYRATPHGRISAGTALEEDSTQPRMPPVSSNDLRDLNDDSYRPRFDLVACSMHDATARSLFSCACGLYPCPQSRSPADQVCVNSFANAAS